MDTTIEEEQPKTEFDLTMDRYDARYGSVNALVFVLLAVFGTLFLFWAVLIALDLLEPQGYLPALEDGAMWAGDPGQHLVSNYQDTIYFGLHMMIAGVLCAFAGAGLCYILYWPLDEFLHERLDLPHPYEEDYPEEGATEE